MSCDCGQAAKKQPAKQVVKRRVVSPASKTVVKRREIKRPAR